MRDITNPKLLYTKGLLFLFAGVLSAGLLIWEYPTLKVVLLVTLAVWCFARAYYFAFYVVQHYVDQSFRYAGLLDFARYAMGRRKGG